MRKLIAFFFTIIFVSGNFAFADGDLWDNFGDTNTYGQMPVSDEEFQQAINSKKGKKKRDKDIPKGQSFSQSNETETLINTLQELPVLLIPANLKIGEDGIIPVGHYQVEGVKKDNQIYLNLYQAHDLIAKIPATETEDDFDQTAINFIELLPHGDYHVRIIFGSINFNAYSIIDIAD